MGGRNLCRFTGDKFLVGVVAHCVILDDNVVLLKEELHSQLFLGANCDRLCHSFQLQIRVAKSQKRLKIIPEKELVKA